MSSECEFICVENRLFDTCVPVRVVVVVERGAWLNCECAFVDDSISWRRLFHIGYQEETIKIISKQFTRLSIFAAAAFSVDTQQKPFDGDKCKAKQSKWFFPFWRIDGQNMHRWPMQTSCTHINCTSIVERNGNGAARNTRKYRVHRHLNRYVHCADASAKKKTFFNSSSTFSVWTDRNCYSNCCSWGS